MGSRTDLIIRIIIGAVIPIVLTVLAICHILSVKLVVGIIMIPTGIYVFSHQNKRRDERTKRLDAFAGGLSWTLTILFLSVLYMLNINKIIQLRNDSLISIIFFFMAYSYWIINFIVSGRSDVGE
jgi:hypothetical protein